MIAAKRKEKNTNIMIDVKKEIIAKDENGVRVSELATQSGVAKSTIFTILKNRETIKKADAASGIIIYFLFQVIHIQVKNHGNDSYY
jgi:hypothetical protein